MNTNTIDNFNVISHYIFRLSKSLTILMISIVCLGSISSLHAEIAPEIGVIPSNINNCPSGSEKITIRMDDDDSPPININDKRSGWTGKWSSSSQVNSNKANSDLSYTKMVFCRVSSNGFKNLSTQSSLRHNYMVLMLSPNCPAGSVNWSRYFDNEDGYNKNSVTGNIAPSTVTKYGTMLKFCYFKGSASGNIAADLPRLSFIYGVLANDKFVTLGHHGTERGWMYSDDEDSNNQNRTNGIRDTTTASDNGIFRNTTYGTLMRLIKRGS